MDLKNFYFIILFIILFVLLLFLQAMQRKIDKIKDIQLMIILLFSYFFISYSDIRFGVCVAVISLISYIAGILIEKMVNKRIVLAGGWFVV